MYELLTQATMMTHWMTVGFIIFTIPAVFLGGVFKKRWAQSAWLRFSHMSMIFVVAVESIFNLPCPLTELEEFFRQKTGQPLRYHVGFIDYWFQTLFQTPIDLTTFIVFAACIFVCTVALFLAFPPRPWGTEELKDVFQGLVPAVRRRFRR